MVINDHDTVDASGLAVFGDVWKVTGIRLPDLAECVLFIGLTVPEIRIPGRFEIVEPDKTLHGIHADCSGKKRFLYEMRMYLRGVHARMFFLDPVDLGNGLIIQCMGNAFVRPDGGHQGIKTAPAVQGCSFFQCFVTVGNGRTVRKSQWRSGTVPLRHHV